jgi:hypothetical protein
MLDGDELVKHECAIASKTQIRHRPAAQNQLNQSLPTISELNETQDFHPSLPPDFFGFWRSRAGAGYRPRFSRSVAAATSLGQAGAAGCVAIA